MTRVTKARSDPLSLSSWQTRVSEKEVEKNTFDVHAVEAPAKPHSYLVPGDDVCRSIAGKVAVLMARQRDCQRSLASLVQQQEAFLVDVHALAQAHLADVEQPPASRPLGAQESNLDGHSPRVPAGILHEARGGLHCHGRDPAVHVHYETPDEQTPSAGEAEGIAAFAARNSGESLASSAASHFHCDPPEEPLAREDASDILEAEQRSIHFSSEQAGGALASELSLQERGSELSVQQPDDGFEGSQAEESEARIAAERRRTIRRQSSLVEAVNMNAWTSGRFLSVLVSDHQIQHHRLGCSANAILHSRFFEPAMGMVIIINAMNIGWTIERELQNESTNSQTIVEMILLSIFCAEIVLRCIVNGLATLKVAWNMFDFVLISATIVSMILTSFGGEGGQDGSSRSSGSLAEVIKQMLILRILRLLRLVRAVRLLQQFRSLWKLVEGLKKCVGTMFSALSLITLSIYLYSCLGAELITKVYRNDPNVGSLVDDKFSNLPVTMLTLFQFIAMDSTAAVYFPMVRHAPHLAIYFVSLVVIVTIALMNLITAVVVEDAMSTAKLDLEMKKHDLRGKLRLLKPAIQTLFHSIDVQQKGCVRIRDVTSVVNGRLRIPVELQDVINPASMVDLFDLLDQDNTGDLTESEFVDGLLCMALSEVPLEQMQMLHLLRSTRREVLKLSRALPPEDGQLGWLPREAAPHPPGEEAEPPSPNHFVSEAEAWATPQNPHQECI